MVNSDVIAEQQAEIVKTRLGLSSIDTALHAEHVPAPTEESEPIDSPDTVEDSIRILSQILEEDLKIENPDASTLAEIEALKEILMYAIKCLHDTEDLVDCLHGIITERQSIRDTYKKYLDDIF